MADDDLTRVVECISWGDGERLLERVGEVIDQLPAELAHGARLRLLAVAAAADRAGGRRGPAPARPAVMLPRPRTRRGDRTAKRP